MRLSRSFYRTLKEAPREAQIPSHRLMFRAGMIQQLASGIYNYLPLALRSLRKIETIIREELDKRGCEEVLMPAVLPAELWKESGRWDLYGDLLLRFRDRKDNDYCMGPTHEEAVTDMVRRRLKSWKQLPCILYQIQGKFRDEFRPRFGLMRAREFLMKDAYSFDRDEENAKKSYRLMHQAYAAIFERCGLKFRAVDAATGEIGGDMSQEFQVLAATGEDRILGCNHCDYAANGEMAAAAREEKRPDPAKFLAMEGVDTPDRKTIEEVSSFLNLESSRFLKCLVYETGTEPVLAVIAGDRDVSEAKLQASLGADSLRLASDETVRRIAGAPAGFVGPVNLNIRMICDLSITTGENWVTGANETDKHLINVNPGRDFTVEKTWDIAAAAAGEHCPRCDDGRLREFRGIEVGQVFYLGTKYSESMACVYQDENGETNPAEMGCYGIGVGRTLAAAIEQHHDEKGMIWPVPIAPWEVVILPLQMDNEAVTAAADAVYADLEKHGIEAVLDDRAERAGFKFKDADLTGYPVQIALGSRSVAEGLAEITIRRGGEKKTLPLAETAAHAAAWIKDRRR